MKQAPPTDRFSTLRAAQRQAHEHAPGLRAIYARAGMTPEDLHSQADLARLPVTSKESLVMQQREAPPFGGFLAAGESDIRRIFASPGPIYEPQFRSDLDGHGFSMAFAAAGIGPGDRVLNTWSYHLVPAGLLLDEAIGACGATVIPSGTGSAEQQAQLIMDLNVSCICASTAFFETLVALLESKGHALPSAWRVRSAFLGGEMGNWLGKRRRLEHRYGIQTFSAYATADFGLIGYEQPDSEGYLIHPERLVQICDPVTGVPLPQGVPGEIVVTTLSAGWPLVRLGTGDVATALSISADGLVERIGLLQGRVGQAVKAREIFIYPRQVEELTLQLPTLQRAQVVVSKPAGGREQIALTVALKPGCTAPPTLEAEVLDRFRQITRLRADALEIQEAGRGLKDDEPWLLDQKYS